MGPLPTDGSLQLPHGLHSSPSGLTCPDDWGHCPSMVVYDCHTDYTAAALCRAGGGGRGGLTSARPRPSRPCRLPARPCTQPVSEQVSRGGRAGELNGRRRRRRTTTPPPTQTVEFLIPVPGCFNEKWQEHSTSNEGRRVWQLCGTAITGNGFSSPQKGVPAVVHVAIVDCHQRYWPGSPSRRRRRACYSLCSNCRVYPTVMARIAPSRRRKSRGSRPGLGSTPRPAGGREGGRPG